MLSLSLMNMLDSVLSLPLFCSGSESVVTDITLSIVSHVLFCHHVMLCYVMSWYHDSIRYRRMLGVQSRQWMGSGWRGGTCGRVLVRQSTATLFCAACPATTGTASTCMSLAMRETGSPRRRYRCATCLCSDENAVCIKQPVSLQCEHE